MEISLWFTLIPFVSSKHNRAPALAKIRLQSILIDFYTDFLLIKNRLCVTQLDTKMDNIGILYSSEKIDFIV